MAKRKKAAPATLKKPVKSKKSAKPKPPAKPKKTAAAAAGSTRLLPPPDSVVVRMYRIGHGDCFLIAFPGKTDGEPAYVLIDCGYKPGSPNFLNCKPKDVAADIRAATDGHLDVVVMTHEHQDHVNAFTATNFKDVTVGEAWVAWTEDPTDQVANDLRDAYKDQLLGLAEGRNRLAAAGDEEAVKRIDQFMAFELGGESDPDPIALAAAAKDPAKSMNKVAMKLIKDRAKNVVFFRPHEKAVPVPGAADGVRVFALGPPRNAKALEDLNPQGSEVFHLAAGSRSPVAYFAAALSASDGRSRSPFSVRYAVDLSTAHNDAEDGTFFSNIYGYEGVAPFHGCEQAFIEDVPPENADWRRIDNDWLGSAEELAVAMNSDTNNASLVLAFELSPGGKVLLFAADAQRGNWISWAKNDTPDGGRKVTTKDLLGRTVLYKAGHHCSHNATLNGDLDYQFPCLGWMGLGAHADEFTAMITAVRVWAETQNGWDHPRKEIKDALIKKASARVLQTDTDLTALQKPSGVSDTEWKKFLDRTVGTDLYFDLTIKI
jgi:beta-lactamase superfamily II metal-dependent hydrolase